MFHAHTYIHTERETHSHVCMNRGTFSFHTVEMGNRPNIRLHRGPQGIRCRIISPYTTIIITIIIGRFKCYSFIRHFLVGDVFYLIIIYAFISLNFKICAFFLLSHTHTRFRPKISHLNITHARIWALGIYLFLFFRFIFVNLIHIIWWHFSFDLWWFFGRFFFICVPYLKGEKKKKPRDLSIFFCSIFFGFFFSLLWILNTFNVMTLTLSFTRKFYQTLD